jgi:hypothetical protein
MYTYIARGLGPANGAASGWALLWCYLFIGTAGLAGFGIFFQQCLNALGYRDRGRPGGQPRRPRAARRGCRRRDVGKSQYSP